MLNISNSTKYILIGSALAIIGFFTPVIVTTTTILLIETSKTISLAAMANGKNMLYISLGCFLGMVAICLAPIDWKKNETKTTTLLITWLISLVPVAILLIDMTSSSSNTSGLLNVIKGLLDEILPGVLDSLGGVKTSPGYGLFIFIFGHLGIIFGLVQSLSEPSNVFQMPQDYLPVDDYYPGAHARPGEIQSAQYAPARQRKPKTQAWLVNDRTGKSYQLVRGTTTIGRLADNDIRIADSKVSKHHAKIIEEKGHFRLVDLASTNGTFVNGKTIRQPVLLHPEDTIRVGDSFKVRFVGMSR